MYIISFRSEFKLLRKLLLLGSEEMEVVTKFFYSSCMKYLKTDIIIEAYSEYRILNGTSVHNILIQKLYIVFCCLGLSS